MKREEYQGWTNKQTWCVALWWNNTSTKQALALQIVRDNFGDPKKIEMALLKFALKHVSEIWAMTDWCWSDSESLTFEVDWAMLREQLEMQIAEERQLDTQKADVI